MHAVSAFVVPRDRFVLLPYMVRVAIYGKWSIITIICVAIYIWQHNIPFMATRTPKNLSQFPNTIYGHSQELESISLFSRNLTLRVVTCRYTLHSLTNAVSRRYTSRFTPPSPVAPPFTPRSLLSKLPTLSDRSTAALKMYHGPR